MKNILFTPLWTEVVFQGRNKQYGAFAIRQGYDRRMIFALLIMMGSFVLGAGVFMGLKATGFLKTVIPTERIIVCTFESFKYPDEVYEMLKQEPTPMEKPKPTATSTSLLAAIEPTVTSSSSPSDAPFEVKTDASASTSSLGGETGVPTETEGNAVSGPTSAPDVENIPEEVGRFAETMPVFPGDLLSYFASHLQYPSAALNAGVEGKLVVEIILDEEGKVWSAKVIKPLGYGLDEEAIRVVKSMPAWSPAKVGGRSVKIKMAIPIKFKITG